MLFMVIETFREHDGKAIYGRLRDRGRSMPDGLKYVSSFVAADLGRCFQLMETNDITLLQRWVAEWQDLMRSRSCRWSRARILPQRSRRSFSAHGRTRQREGCDASRAAL